MRLFIYLLFVILVVGSVYSVRYEISENELIFGFGGRSFNEGIIAFETDTEPILIAIEKSTSIKDFVDINPNKDLRVSNEEVLVIKLNAMNPGKDVSGYININLLYEKLPEKVNYYGDDTIRIPVVLAPDRESVTKVNVKLTEELLPGEEATPLNAGVLLPVIVIIILLFLFKRKWR